MYVTGNVSDSRALVPSRDTKLFEILVGQMTADGAACPSKTLLEIGRHVAGIDPRVGKYDGYWEVLRREVTLTFRIPIQE